MRRRTGKAWAALLPDLGGRAATATVQQQRRRRRQWPSPRKNAPAPLPCGPFSPFSRKAAPAPRSSASPPRSQPNRDVRQLNRRLARGISRVTRVATGWRIPLRTALRRGCGRAARGARIARKSPLSLSHSLSASLAPRTFRAVAPRRLILHAWDMGATREGRRRGNVARPRGQGARKEMERVERDGGAAISRPPGPSTPARNSWILRF